MLQNRFDNMFPVTGHFWLMLGPIRPYAILSQLELSDEHREKRLLWHFTSRGDKGEKEASYVLVFFVPYHIPFHPTPLFSASPPEQVSPMDYLTWAPLTFGFQMG